MLTNDDGTITNDENLDIAKEVEIGMEDETIDDAMIEEGFQVADEQEEGDEIA